MLNFTLFDKENIFTDDIDLVQSSTISYAMHDAMDVHLITALKEVANFSPVAAHEHPIHWETEIDNVQFKVDVLTPEIHGQEPQHRLPALGGAFGSSIPYMDYLIYQEIRAVSLQGGGIPMNVPRPERFAVHKMIISTCRRLGRKGPEYLREKIQKDRAQASLLFKVLLERSPEKLATAINDALDT
jgi:hypothetical protein